MKIYRLFLWFSFFIFSCKNQQSVLPKPEVSTEFQQKQQQNTIEIKEGTSFFVKEISTTIRFLKTFEKDDVTYAELELVNIASRPKKMNLSTTELGNKGLFLGHMIWLKNIRFGERNNKIVELEIQKKRN